MPLLVLSLGSNLGKAGSKNGRKYNLAQAIKFLKNDMHLEKQSSIYETEPEGLVEQPKFLNLVLSLKTKFTPQKCLGIIRQIETDLGRERIVKNGPRTIDLDIIFYDQLIVIEKDLIIPHPRMHQRAFVLVPLAEILPDYIHPIYQKTVAELVKQIDTRGVKFWN